MDVSGERRKALYPDRWRQSGHDRREQESTVSRQVETKWTCQERTGKHCIQTSGGKVDMPGESRKALYPDRWRQSGHARREQESTVSRQVEAKWMCQERAGKHCIQTGGDKVDMQGENRKALYPDRWRQSGCVRREQESTVSRQVETKWTCQERAGKHCIQTGGDKVDMPGENREVLYPDKRRQSGHARREQESTVSRQVETKWTCQERAGKHCIQTGGGKVDVSGESRKALYPDRWRQSGHARREQESTVSRQVEAKWMCQERAGKHCIQTGGDKVDMPGESRKALYPDRWRQSGCVRREHESTISRQAEAKWMCQERAGKHCIQTGEAKWMCQERAGKHCIQTGGGKVDVSGENRKALYPDRWRQSGHARREQESTVSRQVEAKWMLDMPGENREVLYPDKRRQSGHARREQESTVSRQVETKWTCQERAGKHCIQTGGGKVDVSGESMKALYPDRRRQSGCARREQESTVSRQAEAKWMCQERTGKHCIQTGGGKVDVSGESRKTLYPDRWRQSGCVRREQENTVSRQLETK